MFWKDSDTPSFAGVYEMPSIIRYRNPSHFSVSPALLSLAQIVLSNFLFMSSTKQPRTFGLPSEVQAVDFPVRSPSSRLPRQKSKQSIRSPSSRLPPQLVWVGGYLLNPNFGFRHDCQVPVMLLYTCLDMSSTKQPRTFGLPSEVQAVDFPTSELPRLLET